MEWIIKLLTPKILLVYGPMAVMCVALGAALVYLHKMHEQLHAQRLKDIQTLKDEYVALVKEVEKTLDILIEIIAKRGGR